MNSENTIFYSTANKGYVSKAATSLLSIRTQIPDAKLYIISSGMSDAERELLSENDIEYHEVDYKNRFYQTWEYPVDAYYIFFGPEFFSQLNYLYSVYVDGDVYCSASPYIAKGFTELIAGAGFDIDYTTIFLGDTKQLEEKWKTTFEPRKRLNTGVVYFNNKKAAKLRLFDKAAKLYDECIKAGLPRKGDDSLLALLLYIYVDKSDIHYLSERYNATTHNNIDTKVDDIVFTHFTGDKPWNYSNTDNSDRNRTVAQWNEIYSHVASSHERAENKFTKKISQLWHDYKLYKKGLKKSIVQRKRSIKKLPLKVYWWQDYANGIANFGDEITKDILFTIFGRRAEWAAPEAAEFAGVGSITEVLSNRTNANKIDVWGSGFIRPIGEDGEVNLTGLNFHSVRGEKTRSRIGDVYKDIPLGDPGLLANIVYPAAKKKINKIGFVVHYIDLDLEIVDKIKNDPRFVIINPLQPPAEVAKQISACSLILSSSLHGLIFADSFNVPSFHVKFSGNVVGGSYKFEDYYSATNRKYISADVKRIFDTTYLNDLRNAYIKINNLPQKQREIIAAFPKNLQ